MEMSFYRHDIAQNNLAIELKLHKTISRPSNIYALGIVLIS